MIEVRGLCAGYPGRPVLSDVSLEMLPGEVLALVGPNGCGKSTLLRAVLGMLDLSGGTVTVDGVPEAELTSRQLARKIAYLPQSRPVPDITARRMVLHGRFPYLSYPRRYRAEDEEIAMRALGRMDAGELAGQTLPTLSGGQRQKVYLAMALAQQTPNVLLDEPTTYLDMEHQLEVLRTARELAGEGRTVVMVLHDLCLALRAADRVAVLQNGRIRAADTPEKVFASGIMDEVFNIRLRRIETPDGPQYYCA